MISPQVILIEAVRGLVFLGCLGLILFALAMLP